MLQSVSKSALQSSGKITTGSKSTFYTIDFPMFNTNGERSLSALKSIKYYLKKSLGQNHLQHLTFNIFIMCVIK